MENRQQQQIRQQKPQENHQPQNQQSGPIVVKASKDKKKINQKVRLKMVYT